jgi:hypothetical protein
MRKKITKLLRRIANRLDPVFVAADPEPLAFVETVAMANEIVRRNDGAVVSWMRCTGEDRYSGQTVWKIKPEEIDSVMHCIYTGIVYEARNRK